MLVFFLLGCCINGSIAQNTTGAWYQLNGSVETVLLLQPNYFSVTTFDKANKKFVNSWGGKCVHNNDSIPATIEFHSGDPQQVGKKISFTASVTNDELKTNILPGATKWRKTDNNNTVLTGLWVITGREQNGTMTTIVPGERKTIKILTGKRFQWAAINTGTGDFLGTGGGTYTIQDGIYTEYIEFFSRDSSRVGRSLSFRGYVNNNSWDHSGKSSKGDPVHEIWTKLP